MGVIVNAFKIVTGNRGLDHATGVGVEEEIIIKLLIGFFNSCFLFIYNSTNESTNYNKNNKDMNC
jgi:hypothetical protein